MSRPEIGAGDVVVTLDGETVTLRPSLKACTTLSRAQGGITGLVQKCLNYEFDTILSIIVAGLGMVGTGSKDLPERVYKTGLTELAAPCIRYLHIVANGGRYPLVQGEEEMDESPLEPSSSQ